MSDLNTITLPVAPATALAFVDGTRRVEMGLWQIDPVTGETVRGIASAYAVGAVVTGTGQPARFVGERLGRVCAWGGGTHRRPGASQWVPLAVGEHRQLRPADPLNALQDLMRQAVAVLAEELAAAGWLVVLDGQTKHAQGRDDRGLWLSASLQWRVHALRQRVRKGRARPALRHRRRRKRR